jgi:outer membrane protein insertion porin family
MNKIFSITISALLIILTMNGASTEPSRYEGKTVKRVIFLGLKNIDEEDLAYEVAMETQVNTPLNSFSVRTDIINLYNYSGGLFDTIDVSIEESEGGVILTFLFKERKLITEVELKGVGELSETDLTTLISVKIGDPLRIDSIDKSVAQLKAKYVSEGMLNAVIRYDIIPESEEDTVKVVFRIDEGEPLKVQKVSLFGSSKVHVEELLALMETKETGLFRDGVFKRDIFEQDKGKILAYYRQLGYLDAQLLDDGDENVIKYEWTDPDKKEERGIFITLKISEGDIYYFDGYTVKIASHEGDKPVYTIDSITGEFQMATSDYDDDKPVFNDTMFQADRQGISFKYASQGYIFARVVPNRTVTERDVLVDGKIEKRKFVKIDFVIDEGSQAYIEQIIIKGNQKTKDKVIRRELVVKEGELFDARKMQISRELVYNLGFFKQVNVDVRPGSRDGFMNLIIDVEEQPTGTISLGGGYGTTSGFSIFSDLGENNLFGNGQRVGLRLEYGPTRSSVTLSFSERWLLDYPIGFNASIFYNVFTLQAGSLFPDSTEISEYQKEAFGYSLGLSYRFWYYYTVGTLWSHSFKRIVNPSGNSPDTVFILESLGIQEKRAVTMYSYRDSRDNYMNPTSGYRAGAGVTFTGGSILGGEDHFLKYTPEFSIYYSPFTLPYLKSHPCVIEARISATFLREPFSSSSVSSQQNPIINEWLEAEDRLYLGGVETLRGWEYFDFSLPRSWRYVGLYHRIIYGLEFRVPLHPQMLWMALFFDGGALYSDEFWEGHLTGNMKEIVDEDIASGELMRIGDIWNQRNELLSYYKYSYGFGFRIQIPMMPLRFWFGKQMIYDGSFRTISGYNFQFGIGDMRF